MKLLLTSAGLTTPEISQKLRKLHGKEPTQTMVAFIPTAANLEPGNKSWLIDDLKDLKEEGYQVDLVDFSALPKKIWLERLKAADVIQVGGGNTLHLAHWARCSGFAEELPNFLKDRVYVGISAGSMLVGRTFGLWPYDEAELARSIGEDPGFKGLGLVDFSIEPHLNNEAFPEVNKVQVESYHQTTGEKVFLLDDTSAVVVDGNSIEVIGNENYAFG